MFDPEIVKKLPKLRFLVIFSTLHHYFSLILQGKNMLNSMNSYWRVISTFSSVKAAKLALLTLWENDRLKMKGFLQAQDFIKQK